MDSRIDEGFWENMNKVAVSSSRRDVYLTNGLAKTGRLLLRLLKIDGAVLEVVLLNHPKMTKLKKEFYYAGKGGKVFLKSGPVNVLAFPEPPGLSRPTGKKKFLGEIYLNRDLAKGDIDELLYLMIHGLLHLLGYHHDRKYDILKMENKEAFLKKKIRALVSSKNFRANS